MRREVVLVLLGDGPQRAALERTVSARGLNEAVRFEGWSDNVGGWLRTADMLALPSLTEGSPNVVLEAMACGCAVIASDIPACRELIEPQVTGLLRSPAAVGPWVEAIATLAADPSLRLRLAAAARRKVGEGHELSAVVDRWVRLYGSLLGRE
jgi:glycosyltransferase involved in cell wall biosynthesis